jgi:hypothetical protein
VLVFIHGASLPGAQYTTLFTQLQQASPLNLWVVLPGFILDTPNPLEIKVRFSDTSAQPVFIRSSNIYSFFNPPLLAVPVIDRGRAQDGLFAGPLVVGAHLFWRPLARRRHGCQFRGQHDRMGAQGHDAHGRIPEPVCGWLYSWFDSPSTCSLNFLMH